MDRRLGSSLIVATRYGSTTWLGSTYGVGVALEQNKRHASPNVTDVPGNKENETREIFGHGCATILLSIQFQGFVQL